MRDASPVVAVIQARMSSSRLPGKVLMPIAGKPLLWHIVHRLRLCRTVDSIAVATSTDPRDDAIAEFCGAEGVICVRGSLHNVLDRYRLAAEQTGAKTLLRVTGDSPLIDPCFVDYLVTAIAQGDFDFVQLAPGALCAHEGVDVFSRRALDWLTANAADDPVAREHVTSYFRRVSGAVSTAIVPEYKPLAREHARISVDTADDLAFVRAVYDELQAPAGDVSLEEVLKLTQEEPSYRQINAHVRQKTMDQVERHALICCQGGRNSGLGHVRRSLSLARALRDSQGFGVAIGVDGDEAVTGLIRAASFEPVRLEHPADLQGLAETRNFSLAIVDVKDWLSRADVASLAKQVSALAVIDDISDRRLAASHAYYPPVPQAGALSWEGSSCQPRIGWEWCVLGFDPAQLMPAKLTQESAPRIVVSMGGADPLNLTVIALKALGSLEQLVRADFVIGPAFADPEGVVARIENASPHFRALRNVSDLSSVFAGADLAVVAFGVTAYELAALGVPAIYLPISADHAVSAQIFTAAGLGVALPMGVSARDIAVCVTQLMGDEKRRNAVRRAGPALVDGRGAANIAADLAAVSEQRR
jgi:spore coat polysaccharide biosynthesis protein SpsF